MLNQVLRTNKVSAIILTFIRLYLGYAWFEAGLHKITGGFDTSGFLKGAIANPVKGPDGSVVYATYLAFLKSFALPNADIFNVLVPWGELLVGLGLILGCLTTAAMFFGLVMNFAYVMAGTVSSNPMDILLGVIILTAGFNAGKIGLDRWVIPFIRRTTFKENNHTVKQNV
ncbi:DoxX family membrane protein [Neobacillus sp. PS3-34]|uniref:DoxX family membrane protein n=1 Tax=Neobacillus sp. PS3-34 TaxID=3070678 RepID=UPI0027E164EF|nr:DoxX family membrane protein [Neobacillus sp. PS3-34]WML49025.1 DoxX family membrane protein [Neobacillus sp. PS3-34]